MTASLEDGDIADVPVERAPETPRSAWLARRSQQFGASEVPVLLAWRGVIDVERCPQYVRDDLEHGRWDVPIFLARKAGLAGRKPRHTAMRAGSERERELLRTWAARADVWLVTAVQHADTVPEEWLPIRDWQSPHLAATPDAWARCELDGGLVAIELKCTMGLHQRDERAIGNVPHFEAQVQAEIAALGCTRGLLVIGSGWAGQGEYADRPILTHEIARDEARIAQIREVCAEAWAEVQRLRARRKT